MNFCDECGQGNQDDAAFCVQCGTALKPTVLGGTPSGGESTPKVVAEAPPIPPGEAVPPPGAVAPPPGEAVPPPGAAAPPPPGIPPPPGAQAPPPGQAWVPPRPPGPGGIPPPGYVPMPRKTTDGMAVAALIMGIVGFLFWCIMPAAGVLAVVFGYMGRRKIAESKGALEGDSFCTAGIILGFIEIGISILIGIIWAIIAIVATTHSSSLAPVTASLGVLCLLGAGLELPGRRTRRPKQ